LLLLQLCVLRTQLSNVAVTVVAAVTVVMHAPVPEQPPPDHPKKTSPLAGVAVNVTVVS
jgi:hypothetical protein